MIKPRRHDQETIFTNDFRIFSSFYGFKLKACKAYSDHEKGNVENKVGYIRCNFINPALVIKDLNHFTQLLEKQLNTANNLEYIMMKSSINELLEEDYPVFKVEKAKSNKYDELNAGCDRNKRFAICFIFPVEHKTSSISQCLLFNLNQISPDVQ